MEQLLPVKRKVLQQKKELFLGLLENLKVSGNVSKAISASRFKRTTVYRWRNNDKEFAKKWDIIVETANELLVEEVEHKLLEAAQRGSVRAQIFILQHREPEVWNRKSYCANCNK